MKAMLGGRGRAFFLVLAFAVTTIGTAASGTKPASAAVSGHLQVCASSAYGAAGQPVSFSVKTGHGVRKLSMAGGACSSSIAVLPGKRQITELPTAPTSYLLAYTVKNGSKLNRQNRTVTVKVGAGKQAAPTQISFVNVYPVAYLTICNQADPSSPTLAGTSFGYDVTSKPLQSLAAGPFGSPRCTGPLEYSAGSNITISQRAVAGTHVQAINVVGAGAPGSTKPATGSTSLRLPAGITVVTYTNSANASTGYGYVEVCKQADGPYVSGQFTFDVTDSTGTTSARDVYAGQCSDAIRVAAGNVSVRELPLPGFTVSDIKVTSAEGDLGATNLINGTASVVVPVSDSPNDEVQVTYWNRAATARLTVCKTLTSTSGALAGTPFTFDISGAAQDTITIYAGTPNNTQCVQSPSTYPVGSRVTVTERDQPYVSVVDGNERTVTVGAGINTVTFTNQALGYLEICKAISDDRTLTGAAPAFDFAIAPSSGPGISRTLRAGLNGAVHCTDSIALPTGPATVTEAAVTDYHVVGASVNGVAAPAGNAVTVNVVYGPPTNEQLIYVTNAIDTATIKVCTSITDASLSRAYSFSTDSATLTLPAWFSAFTLTPLDGAPDCAAVFDVPVLGADLQPSSFAATELPNASLPASQLQDVSALGGSLSSVDGVGGDPNQGGSATVTLSDSPLTAVNFVNGWYVSPPPAG